VTYFTKSASVLDEAVGVCGCIFVCVCVRVCVCVCACRDSRQRAERRQCYLQVACVKRNSTLLNCRVGDVPHTNIFITLRNMLCYEHSDKVCIVCYFESYLENMS